MSSEFYIGRRLSYSGDLCTVRYFGHVAGTKGEWLGVEWDDPTRGKHIGQAGGKTYFECIRKDTTAGSFIRPSRPADGPRSFLEALRYKYASDSASPPEAKDDPMTLIYENGSRSSEKPVKISGKEVEEVGFDKIRRQLAELHELRIVLLDGLCMSQPIQLEAMRCWMTGNVPASLDLTSSEILKTCPRIAELDLSRNLFEDWIEIAFICQNLRKLRDLRLDGNRFRNISFPHESRDVILSIFSDIQKLSLEDTLLSWTEIHAVCTYFEGLDSLVLCDNQLSKLDIEPVKLSLPHTITNLDIGGNLFVSLSELRPLCKLSNLQRLVLNHGKMMSISNDHSHPSDFQFSTSLKKLELAFNLIESWEFVSELHNVFPGLTGLRISHNPLYQSLRAPDGRPLSADDGYMLTIGRLGLLDSLNFSPITIKDRLNAETYYLSQIVQELSLSPETVSAKVKARHPRYRYLCEEYGEPEIRRSLGTLHPDSLAASLINVKFKMAAAAISFDVEIPRRLSIYSVLGIVSDNVKLSPFNLRLVWETDDWIIGQTGHVDDYEQWDSDDNGEEEGAGGQDRVKREVELLPGTRSLGTWVDGKEVTIRVEIK